MAKLSLLTVASIALAIHPLSARAQAAPDQPHRPAAESERAVLITGATTGIGRETAELLAANGFHVYAGARSEEDIAELSRIENVQGIRLDVTSLEDITAAVETVRAEGRGLYGLINNAGVAVVAPLIELREEDLEFQMDVNVFGPYRVTKAFAPLLIESQGRILTTGSISGFVVWGFGGPYTMSKHAVEAFTDALAAEMAPFGVEVGIVEPGNYKSQIMANMRERMIENGYTAEGSLYKDQLEGFMEMPVDRGQYKEPDEVAQAFLLALTDEEPKRRYMVVPDEAEAEVTIRAVLTRLIELNDAHPYSYTRDELVGMLDEALAAGSR